VIPFAYVQLRAAIFGCFQLVRGQLRDNLARPFQLTTQQFNEAFNRLVSLAAEGLSYVKIGRELGGELWRNRRLIDLSSRFWTSLDSITFVPPMNAFKLFDSQDGTLTVPRLLSQARGLNDKFHSASPGSHFLRSRNVTAPSP
jgi:hypothetical protein